MGTEAAKPILAILLAGFPASGKPALSTRLLRDPRFSNTALAVNEAGDIGLHAGKCEIPGNDISGLAVHLAARVAAIAEANELLVSRTVRDLVAGSNFEFEERGEHQLKGFSEKWSLYAVSSAKSNGAV